MYYDVKKIKTNDKYNIVTTPRRYGVMCHWIEAFNKDLKELEMNEEKEYTFGELKHLIALSLDAFNQNKVMLYFIDGKSFITTIEELRKTIKFDYYRIKEIGVYDLDTIYIAFKEKSKYAKIS